MKDAGDRHHKRKLEIEDGLKNKIKTRYVSTILNKEKRKKKKGGRQGVHEVLVHVHNVQCACWHCCVLVF